MGLGLQLLAGYKNSEGPDSTSKQNPQDNRRHLIEHAADLNECATHATEEHPRDVSGSF